MMSLEEKIDLLVSRTEKIERLLRETQMTSGHFESEETPFFQRCQEESSLDSEKDPPPNFYNNESFSKTKVPPFFAKKTEEQGEFFQNNFDATSNPAFSDEKEQIYETQNIFNTGASSNDPDLDLGRLVTITMVMIIVVGTLFILNYAFDLSWLTTLL